MSDQHFIPASQCMGDQRLKKHPRGWSAFVRETYGWSVFQRSLCVGDQRFIAASLWVISVSKEPLSWRSPFYSRIPMVDHWSAIRRSLCLGDPRFIAATLWRKTSYIEYPKASQQRLQDTTITKGRGKGTDATFYQACPNKNPGKRRVIFFWQNPF